MTHIAKAGIILLLWGLFMGLVFNMPSVIKSNQPLYLGIIFSGNLGVILAMAYLLGATRD